VDEIHEAKLAIAPRLVGISYADKWFVRNNQTNAMKTLLRHIATGQYFRSLDSWTADLDEAYDFGLIAKATRFAHKAHISGLELILSLDGSEQNAAIPFEKFRLGLSHGKTR
jgi:hypothetical protein